MSRQLMLLSSALVLSVGCSNYVYRSPTASGGSVRVATEQEAHGKVMLRSPGIERLPTATSGDERALHVVMTVANDCQHPWRIDSRTERVVFPDGSERAPVLAMPAQGEGPVLVVPPGSERTVDLYFPVPPEEARESQLPSFATRWQVETERGTLRGQTPFNQRSARGLITPCGAQASAYCLAGYT
jgi:hypothetical protein